MLLFVTLIKPIKHLIHLINEGVVEVDVKSIFPEITISFLCYSLLL